MVSRIVDKLIQTNFELKYISEKLFKIEEEFIVLNSSIHELVELMKKSEEKK